MKLSFLKQIQKFAITRLGAIQDSDSNLSALMERNGMLEPAGSDGAESDGWGDFDIDDFDFDPEAEITDTASTDAYIDRQISKIPQFGDGARWRLASYLDMFGDLSRDGTLTPEQRDAVDNFVLAYEVKNND